MGIVRTKSLRELQQRGERAIEGDSPLLLTSRKGVVGILLPVNEENLLDIQQDVQRITALQSLRKTWARAREAGLADMAPEDIDEEVKKVRRASRRGRRAK